ncbi:MAG: T9SS type A sorting domain-containing protein [Candidatus Marinimicrobia bacterium]|nr:T9SS type A sorting domain-containing protein [Candidatus Neomarinimicrobiota bacterium]
MNEGTFASENAWGASWDNLAPGIPIEIMADDVSSTSPEIGIMWQQNDEDDLFYYSLYKSELSGAYGEPLLSGHGWYNYVDNQVEYIDPEVIPGITYYYVVTATDIHGNESGFSNEVSAQVEIVGVDELSGVPTEFALHQNYPNPFNPNTVIRYDIPAAAYVTITITDLLGREVRQLAAGKLEPGWKSVTWDATDATGKPVGAGVYLYRLTAGSFVQTNKMILLK